MKKIARNVFLSEEELASVRKAAQSVDRNVSNFMRYCVLKEVGKV